MKKTKYEKKNLRLSKETQLEDLWDWICVHIGFDKKGREVQQAIKKFIELKKKLDI